MAFSLPKGPMNPQPSGMTVPVDSRMGMDEGWAEGAANADWSGGGIDWRNQDIYTVKPKEPVNPDFMYTHPNLQKQVEDYSALAPMYGNFLKGAGGAVADIGRSFFDPTSWRWGEEQYNPAFQPDQSDSMAQRAGYELISGMTAGMPEGPPDFQKMSDFDMAMHLTDVVDPSGLGGDVARLVGKSIPEGTLAATAGVMVQRAKNKLKGSKVVDTQGTPIRVYHGTGASFNEWDPNLLEGGSLKGKGFHFTEVPSIAGGYAQTKPFFHPITGEMQHTPNIHATYLNLQNPIYLDKIRKKDVVDKMADEIFAFAKGSPTAVANPSESFEKLSRSALNEQRADDLRAFSQNLYNASADRGFFDPDDFLDDIGINAYDIDTFIDNGQWDEAEAGLRKWYMAVTETNDDTQRIVNDFFRYNQDRSQIWGKEVWTDGLQELGYDGMAMIGQGGWGAGGGKHRVWIAFDEKSIFPFAELEGMKPELPPSGDFSKMLENIFKAGMGR